MTAVADQRADLMLRMIDPRRTATLYGRHGECATVDRLLAAVRGARSEVLVVRGESGVGKTALLDYAVRAAADLRVVQIAGVESEQELDFAGLHQLCRPMLNLLDGLRPPQREALEAAFGLWPGPVPDRFLVGVAVLALLSEAAGKQPMACMIDDAQWLDHGSAQILAFVARRLQAEPVLMMFAAGQPVAELTGLPELKLEALADADARDLLASVLRWPLDEQVRDRIVAENRGNPQALVELAHGLSPARLAGGFGLPEALPLAGLAEDSFARQLQALPAPTRLLLAVAAAEPAGDPAVLWRAAAQLDLPAAAAMPAARVGLVEPGLDLRFRHPLVRSAAYRAATPDELRNVHRALAAATDPQADPDRRAWHRSRSVPGRHEPVAAELVRAAGRAQARGGLAAAGAFLERAAELSPDPSSRAERTLAAATAMVQAGRYHQARELLGAAEADEPTGSQQASTELVRAQLGFACDRGHGAAPALLQAARQLAATGHPVAQATYLDALNAAMFAGHLARPRGGTLEVTRAAQAAQPSPVTVQPASGWLRDGLVAHFSAGYQAGLPVLRRALCAADYDQQQLRWLWPAGLAAIHLWDEQAWDALSARYVRLARDAGALSELPLALGSRILWHLFAGDLAAAEPLTEEAWTATEATGSSLAPYGALGLAAVRGRDDDARALIEAASLDVSRRGEGLGLTATRWAAAVLGNGLGRYAGALAAAEQACADPAELGLAAWSRVELVEAAARAGQPGRAEGAMRLLTAAAEASGTDWALGVHARSAALLSHGPAAERLYQAAIERLDRTRLGLELARAHLVYGEWLRRENRRTDARGQLRRAHQLLASMGAEGFAERARRELLATGETVRKRTLETASELTAQELQIALRAGAGQTNAEIGAELFLSPRTVEWHLHKVFAKFGITSRRELRRALPGSEKTTAPV